MEDGGSKEGRKRRKKEKKKKGGRKKRKTRKNKNVEWGQWKCCHGCWFWVVGGTNWQRKCAALVVVM